MEAKIVLAPEISANKFISSEGYMDLINDVALRLGRIQTYREGGKTKLSKAKFSAGELHCPKERKGGRKKKRAGGK